MLSIKYLSYTVGQFKLPELNLTVEEGSYTMLLGPSGSGKSVILELLAGLRRPAGGTILLDGVDITPLPPAQRSVGLLFQDYALFPHLSVFNNIAYSLRIQHKPVLEIAQEIAHFALNFEIEPLLKRFPEGLSGGEKQRVALARTLISHPRLLLLDEPLSALDASLRGASRDFLKKINQSGQTIIHVTHDKEEVEALGTHCGQLKANGFEYWKIN